MTPNTHRIFFSVVMMFLGMASIAISLSGFLGSDESARAQQPDGQKQPIRTQQDRPGKARGLLAQMSTFKTDVPAHPFDIVLVRPTATSMAASVVAYTDGEGYIEFGTKAGIYDRRTPQQKVLHGEPTLFVMSGLTPGTQYTYRWRSRDAADAPATPASKQEFAASEPYSFRTARSASDHAAFTFTIQADSHLDANVTPEVYLRTLANALADKPDFHIDLGDTFMTDKRGKEFKDSLPQYVAQRFYFGQLCHSAPLFIVLGNHDGEVGYANEGPNSMGPWSFAERTKYFPAPQIEDNADGKAMYSGRTSYAKGHGAHYYEFTWGDAQLIVLDPFWFTTVRPRGGGGGGPGLEKKEVDVASTDENWSRTLGKEQYDWLTRTLEGSQAKYRFVFIHHLVGGLGKANRGGMESSVLFEWGGKNADGSAGFAEHRPGWAMPIHDLLVKHKVSAVFHGHDHLYVRGERDGVVYQCVPQPGNVAGGTRSAAEYGYKSGTIVGSPGYLRVRIGADLTAIEFIRSAVANADEGRRIDRPDVEGNGTVVHQYSITPAGKEQPPPNSSPENGAIRGRAP
jgi:hypothetical protein